ncbi:O-methyltransferase [Pectobacterium carotovorum]|uniref:O-methyltransferase n=1 Tax=Pectobacterium carotovorum TaxID=554 RepID=UPI0029DAA15C|nr:O-methyltransferase [Pectobacterium carotovorum]MDX6913592.1 O-methyltransferase [Pectobacterium carotovorum]
MSTGGSIPYHLRQNKAIERNLFIESLRRLNNYTNISEYVYIGFGGPFLEDFKQVHNMLKVNKMISIEGEANVHKRQQFNKPLSCINLGDRPEMSGDFINRYNFDDKTIIWLDYASPSDLNSQLNELVNLITKLKPKDIFKITLNANPESLGKEPGTRDPRPFRYQKLNDILTDSFLPVESTESDVSFKKYPALLINAVKRAVENGLRGRSDIRIHPLTGFVYKDGQQMVTLTAIVLDNSDEEEAKFLNYSRIRNWPFYAGEWIKPKDINVPVMSLKERIHIESLLPEASVDNIHEELGFFIGPNSAGANIDLNNFIEYYKVVPWYSKVLF